MDSEVQHIINISLKKIVSSRQRKSGISLHRNLLVASVLFKAKDAYIAETVAKRKRDMDAEAVVPTFEQTSVEEELSEAMEDMDTDISSIPQLDIEHVDKDDDDFKESGNLEKNDGACPLENDFHEDQLELGTSRIPENSSLELSSSLQVRPRLDCNRKRRNNCDDEVCDYSDLSDRNRSTDDEKSESSLCDCEMYAPSNKQPRVDDSTYNTAAVVFSNELASETPELVNKSDYRTSLDNKWNFCIDVTSDDDDSDEEDNSSSRSKNDVSDCYRSICLSSNQTYGGQVYSSQNLSQHSSMLIATM